RFFEVVTAAQVFLASICSAFITLSKTRSRGRRTQRSSCMKFRRFESGQVFVLAAFGLVVILAFTALASDLGYFQSQRRKMQTAADTDAMAGEPEVIACNTANVSSAAKNDATLNGFTDGSNNVTVSVNNPPTSGSYSGSARSVEVIISQVQPTYFLRAVGI